MVARGTRGRAAAAKNAAASNKAASDEAAKEKASQNKDASENVAVAEPANPSTVVAEAEKKADDVEDSSSKMEVSAQENDSTKPEETDASKEEAQTAESKVFKYKDSFNATAEEHEASPFLWIRTKSLTSAVNESLVLTQAALNDVFANKLEVAVPKLKLPPLTHLYVEMKSLEDKFKVMSATSRPEKWGKRFGPPQPSVIVTQSVVIREEDYSSLERGTLEEALDVLLPLRNTIYKDQLAMKSKELDETLDEVVKLMAEAKDRKTQKPIVMEKPAMDGILPLVPNVGYEKSVYLDLEQGADGKITPGIRVQYEKDGVKKIYLLPASECSHIPQQMIKAAESIAAFLSDEGFTAFDGKSKNKDVYGLKFMMNEIGQMIVSVVLVIDDKFVDEFYDITNNDEIAQEVTDYFTVVSAKKNGKPDSAAAQDDGDDEEGSGDPCEDEGNVTVESQQDGEKETAKNNEQKKEAENGSENVAEKVTEDKQAINIMRESMIRPMVLEKSPFLCRVKDQIHDHLDRFGPALKRFFEEKCSALGVDGIYITWHATNKRPTEWNRKVKHWYHVCGSKSVVETIGSVKLELLPHLEGHYPPRTEVIPTLMNVLIDNLGIDSSSKIVVACDYFFVQNFFAHKCKKVMMVSFMNENLRNDIKQRFRGAVSFVSAKAKQVNIVDKCKRHFEESPSAVIHWGQFQDMPIKKLFQHRVKRVAVVFDPRDRFSMKHNSNNRDVLKKMNLLLHPNYTLKKVVGIDVFPQRSKPVSIIAFYEAISGPAYNQRGLKRKQSYQNDNRRYGGQGGKQYDMRRRQGRGAGGAGGFNKRQRLDDNRRPPPLGSMPPPRGSGNRSRFGQRTQQFGRSLHPWSSGGRHSDGRGGNFNNEPPAEHTVQAAKAVLSQLNTLIENQLILAQMNVNPIQSGPRNDNWGGRSMDSYNNSSGGDSSFFSDRDRSPLDYRPRNDYSGGRGDYGDRRGEPMRRGSGGGDKSYRFNRRN